MTNGERVKGLFLVLKARAIRLLVDITFKVTGFVYKAMPRSPLMLFLAPRAMNLYDKELEAAKELRLFLRGIRLADMAEAGASDEELSAEVRHTMDIIGGQIDEEVK